MYTSHKDFTPMQLGTIMCVWAHPDDETFTMGGLLYACATKGQKVICVTATRGEAGVQDTDQWPAKDLAKIRTKELEDALKILGVTKHYWLGYADGGCSQLAVKEPVDKISKLITTYKPDSIFTFGPEGLTGHDDHKAVSWWTSQALKVSKHKAVLYHAILTREQYRYMKVADERISIFFNINMPVLADEADCDICYHLPTQVFSKKLQALQAMPSQTDRLVRGFEYVLADALGVEAFRRV
jgi:LmbE family N-acetylglucosaminyl deacetylase